MMALTLRDFDAELDRQNQFDANPVADETPQDVPVFTFTEEELGKLLADARSQGVEQGREEGFADGQREAKATIEAQSVAALEAIHGQMDSFLSQDAQRRNELQADLIDMVLEICERVVPDVVRSYSADRVQARLAETIQMGAEHAQLSLRLSPTTLKTLEKNLVSLLPADQSDRLKIVADPALKNGEAQMNWQNGFMNYSLDRVCDELMDALRNASTQMHNQPEKV